MDFINYSDLLTRAPISWYPSVSPLIYLLGASKEGLTCFRMLSLEVFPILQAHHSWWLQSHLRVPPMTAVPAISIMTILMPGPRSLFWGPHRNKHLSSWHHDVSPYSLRCTEAVPHGELWQMRPEKRAGARQGLVQHTRNLGLACIQQHII